MSREPFSKLNHQIKNKMRVKELLDKANIINIIQPLASLDDNKKSYRAYLGYISKIIAMPEEPVPYNLVIKPTYDGVLSAVFENGWESAEVDLRTVKWSTLANCEVETDFDLNNPRICDRLAFFIMLECTAFGDDFGAKEVLV